MGAAPACLVIACGALAREIVALRALNDWPHMVVQCLPADLHNRPEKIPAAVREKIRASRGKFASVFVAYADCGTGGLLDAVLAVAAYAQAHADTLVELDVNPLLVLPQGAGVLAVDALIRLNTP